MLSFVSAPACVSINIICNPLRQQQRVLRALTAVDREGLLSKSQSAARLKLLNLYDDVLEDKENKRVIMNSCKSQDETAPGHDQR
eukprot:1141583-Pelagomonas_calceolata.AAC.1